MTGKICGTGSWAPDRVWDNNDLAKMVETSDQWIRERTGVVQRHIAKEDEDTVTMAAGAALKALEDAEMKAEEISNRDHALCGMWGAGAARSGKGYLL